MFGVGCETVPAPDGVCVHVLPELVVAPIGCPCLRCLQEESLAKEPRTKYLSRLQNLFCTVIAHLINPQECHVVALNGHVSALANGICGHILCRLGAIPKSLW